MTQKLYCPNCDTEIPNRHARQNVYIDHDGSLTVHCPYCDYSLLSDIHKLIAYSESKVRMTPAPATTIEIKN